MKPHDLPPRAQLRRIASAVQRETLASLPAPLREATKQVAFILQSVPGPEEDDPDLLGLFCGPTWTDLRNGEGGLPPQIFLYLDNLWDEADGDETTFREEVAVTLLHELGHFLGLDEDDMEERGLD